jgi:hypothetical protein
MPRLSVQLLAILALTFSGACQEPERESAASSTSDSTRSTAAVEPVLLFELESVGESCVWRLHELPGNIAHDIHVTEECPSDVIWLPSEERVAYFIDGTFYVDAWPPTGHPGAFEWPESAGPKQDRWSPAFTETWISAQTGRPRLASMYAASTRGNVVVYRSEDREFSVQRDGRDMSYYIKDGKTYAHDPGESERIHLPSWGTLNIAVVVEFSDGGAWKEIAAAPTKCEAGDTPCLDVLENYMKQPSDAISMRKSRQICARAGCQAPDGWKERTDIVKLLGYADDWEDAGYRAFDDRRGMLFLLSWGDTPHAVAPVYYCENACATVTRLESPEGPVSVAFSGPYALIAEEHTNEDPRVYLVGQTTPLLEPRGTVVFLPPSPLWKHSLP